MSTKIGSPLEKREINKSIPPIVFQLQVNGYIPLTKPEELKQWEEDVKLYHGVSIKAGSVHACETCSAGCSDDCGMLH